MSDPYIKGILLGIIMGAGVISLSQIVFCIIELCSNGDQHV